MKVRNILGNRYRGQIGKDTIASSWKGRNYVKAYAVPRNPRTERQQANRARFGGAKEAWRALSEEARAEYGRRAGLERMSGWNLYVREHMARASSQGVDRRTEPEAPSTEPAREPATSR